MADNLRDGSSRTISVSVIAPAAYLRDFAGQSPATVHHVAAQRVLRDLSYREFFLEEQQRGAAIILDNGVFDLGESLSPDDLVRAARAVHAGEIILPDVMHDGPATMQASDHAAAQILSLSDEFRLCVVIHGADDAEWHRCYDHFASAGYVGAVAFPASRRRNRARAVGEPGRRDPLPRRSRPGRPGPDLPAARPGPDRAPGAARAARARMDQLGRLRGTGPARRDGRPDAPARPVSRRSRPRGWRPWR